MESTRQFHPVADLFPLLSGDAFRSLVADIKENGLREPILEDADGRILDGRNRYLACLQAGVAPRFVRWQDEGSTAELALSRNLHRRHLNESQRALLADRVAALPAGRISLTGLRALAPGRPVTATLHHADGTSEEFSLNHTLNQEQIEWFKAGSALNLLRLQSAEPVRA